MLVTISSNDAINWNPENDTEKKINEVINILRTRKGEIPFMRGVGISDEFIDRPLMAIKPAIINNVTEAITEDVDGVELQSIDFVFGDNVGDFIIKVECIIE